MSSPYQKRTLIEQGDFSLLTPVSFPWEMKVKKSCISLRKFSLQALENALAKEFGTQKVDKKEILECI